MATYESNSDALKNPDWRKLSYASRVATADAGSILTVGFDDGVNGITFTVDTNVISSDDPGNGAYIVWDARDIFGERLTGSFANNLNAMIRKVTAPTLTSSLWVVVGFCSESDLTSGTVDGVGVGLYYTGGSATIRSLLITNGSATATNDGTPVGTSERVQMTLNPAGNQIKQVQAAGLTDAGVRTGDVTVPNWNQTLLDGVDLFFFMGVGTNTANAGTEAVEFAPFELGYPAPPSGEAPT